MQEKLKLALTVPLWLSRLHSACISWVHHHVSPLQSKYLTVTPLPMYLPILFDCGLLYFCFSQSRNRTIAQSIVAAPVSLRKAICFQGYGYLQHLGFSLAFGNIRAESMTFKGQAPAL
jgi:hypothetical protein